MNNQQDPNDLYLLDVLNYEREIKGHPLLQIYAGPGSGKNYFAERFITGDPTHGIPQKTVLLVTSRKSKVLETLSDDSLDIGKSITGPWSSYHRILAKDENTEGNDHIRILHDEWGEHRVYQKSTICTNAFIAKYLQYCYDPTDITTHLWELFDLIIIDEIHSLILDSTYQTAPYYIRDLIKEFRLRKQLAAQHPDQYRQPLCEQLILMTGTPEPLRKLKFNKGWVILDKRTKCRNVQPRNVHLITYEDAKQRINDQLKDGQKIVYFCNHTITPREFCKGTQINPDDVTVSFTKEEKRIALYEEDESAAKRMAEVETHLTECSRLPDNVQLFVSTSRNKEGINIKNKDIHCMYIESHIPCDVMQMAARVREGIEDLYIVTNSEGHRLSEWRDEAEFTKLLMAKSKSSTGAANEFMERICNQENIKGLYKHHLNALTTAYSCGNPRVTACIEVLENKFSYLRYSYFDNQFHFDSLREKERTTKFKMNLRSGNRCKITVTSNCFRAGSPMQQYIHIYQPRNEPSPLSNHI